jgi:hypothetical protein
MMRGKFLVVIGFVLGTALSVFSEEAETGWHSTANFSLKYAGLDGIIVENMPLAVRSVPIHPDDSYANVSDWAPIQRTRFNSNGMFSINGDYAFQNSKFRLCAGLTLFFSMACQQERNYTDAPGTESRGGGAALTYVAMKELGIVSAKISSPFEFLDNISPEISGDVKLSEKYDLSLGTSISYFRLQVESGWDRFDSKQIDNVFVFGDYLPVSVYLRWCGISLGIYYPLELNRTEIGKEADIRIYPTFVIKTEFGADFAKIF